MKRSFLLFIVLACLVAGTAAQPYTIEQYLSIKAASAPSFSPDGTRIVFLANYTGTTQVWITWLPTDNPRRLTDYEDNISFVRWLADDSGIIFGKARGGDENTQFYWMKRDGTGVRALTNDPTVRHNFALVSHDGKTLWYTSNKRNRTFFDVYSMDIASGKEELRYQHDGNNSVAAVNDAGTKFIIARDGTELSLDDDLYLVDAATKTEVHLTPHKGAVQYGNVNFVADGIVYAHNEGREFFSLSQMRKKNAARDDWSRSNLETTILDNTPWDIGGVAMDVYGNKIAYALNRDGFSEIYIRKYETGGKPLITTVEKRAEMIELPGRGIVSGLTFNKLQNKLAFTFSSPTQNSDVWLYDLTTRERTRVTKSGTSGIFPESFIEPTLIKYKSFDGREIPAWYYLPKQQRYFSIALGGFTGGGLKASTDRVPVIVSVHGGPEGQSRPGFSGLFQYYLSRGYAILDPNVRGSTGYGKTYTHLDDVKKREDSVKDLAYAVEWLKTSGNADPKRIAVMGGSYGGYMTLAAITLYPEIWSAAVSTVGISNWESFLKNTSGYRRRQREVEYGRLDRDIDFLRAISPLAKIDRIKCPLFVIAGRNDPRVPYTEGEQMVDALRKRGAVVEWKLYDDEGHGISKLKNRLELYPLVADFLDKYMGKK